MSYIHSRCFWLAKLKRESAGESLMLAAVTVSVKSASWKTPTRESTKPTRSTAEECLKYRVRIELWKHTTEEL